MIKVGEANKMEKQKFRMEKPKLIKILVCFAIIAVFWMLPGSEPLTEMGMKVIGVFIGIVLLLSIVDTIWPALLAVVLLSRTGATTLNNAIAGSLGSWIVYFVLMSFIMTYALNESGFTTRLVAKYMRQKFITKSPWTFTFALGALGMLLGAFMDQVPATSFMLAFVSKVYQELGYKKEDKYPAIANLVTVFGVNIGGAMTPISHSLVILGLGIYENATGEAISLFTYLAYGLPTGLLLFALMCIIVRLFAKFDAKNFGQFDVDKVIAKQEPMQLKEILTVVIFFATVLMWILPGVLKMFAPASEFVAALGSYGITFWAILSVVIMSIISINEKPLIDIKNVVNSKINWGILLFISIGTFLGSAMVAEGTGITEFVSAKIQPLTASVPELTIVLIIAFTTTVLTNFASNVSTITVMTGVSVALAMATKAVDPAAIAMTTTLCGCCAYVFPSSFATIAMLHADDWSDRGKIYIYGIVLVVITTLIAAFVGYPIGKLL